MTETTPPTPHHSRSGTGNKALSQESLHATVSAVIQATRLTLKEAGIEEAPLEGEVLVRHVAGIDRASLYSNPDRAFSDAEAQQLATLVARRCKREPLPYILGHWEFYCLDFIDFFCNFIFFRYSGNFIRYSGNFILYACESFYHL